MALTGLNITFPIKNADGTAFHNLVLRKATVNSVVMSLGDKITGDVYYKDNTLAVTMQEYIEYDGVRYSLVNPPTIVREGMVSDNSEFKGMTKYSFEFYHPMYMLGNFPFSDIAVNSSQEKYLSQNKSFSWIGYLAEFVAKINKNLEGTQWVVVIGSSVQQDILTKLSDVLSFDNTTIADALKTGYETWEVPYVVDTIASDSAYYAQGKRFMVQYGLPTTEIVDGQGNPFVFHFGKGVGLKNNSRTPRNNKIITRIAGYGSENNIPYGYPQIVWTGNQDWDYTINNDPTAENSYPIYKGIVGGAYVKLIKHPFTRTHLMPSIYSETVNKKVNPYAIGYDPTTEIKDYYDADNTYDNPIKDGQPSYEIHAFEDIKPELTSAYSLQAAVPYDQHAASQDFVTKASFLGSVLDRATSTEIALERAQMLALYNSINNDTAYNSSGSDDSYEYSCVTTSNSGYFTVTYKSSNFNFTSVIQITQQSPEWDDTMDEDGNYVQSYFQITLPQLTFDIYACAAITEEMKINMRSGACIGCTFPVQVDWDDYKKNFYDSDGNFAPTGAQRDYTKYPDSSQGTITILVQKENDTFGTLIPNIYQKPQSGDKFVILGISLPLSYITSAESRLDDEMKAYMRENNVYYYDYPLKFDEHFLATYTSVLNQMKNNVLVRFDYAGTQHALYIKQMMVKYGDNPLPQYDITLTDDIEVVLNQIGQAVEDISNLHSLLSEQQQKTLSLSELDARYIRKDIDDDAAGIIRFIRGMQVGEHFVTGLLGEGGIFRRDADGKTYIETDKLYVRMKAYFDTVEIRKYQHSSGNRIASNAGVRCSRVEYIDSNNNITTNVASANIFRCYFKASEDDKSITNDFVVGDLAFCSETNVNTGGLSQHRYWRAVVGKSLSTDTNGEHYIDLSVSDCESGSDIPIAQDDIVQLGNKTDTTRQGAIIEFISGGDAPSYQIYQGINTYSLDNKNYIGMGYSSSTGRAYLNVYGDFRFGSRDNNGSYITYNAGDGSLNIRAIINAQSTIGSQSIPDYIKANQNNYNDAWVHSAIDDLQSQIDGEIDSWFYNYLPVANLDSKVPLTNKEPYKTWYEADAGGTQSEVTTERTKHLGDTFYDNSSGYAFRFSLNENTNAFEWILITDSAVVQALANAAKAQETADGKRATYSTWGSWVKNGVNTLKQGDLFIPTSDYTDTSVTPNVTYKARKVYKCATDGQNTFTEINYTDDSALTTFLDGYSGTLTTIQNQIDGKAETWRQPSNPASSWTDSETQEKHVGDLWMDTSPTGGNKTYIYVDNGASANPRYSWVAQDVPTEVFTKIDGKASIFVTQPSNYKANDLWILAEQTTVNGVTYKQGEILTATADSETYNQGHWVKKVNYTNDDRFEAFVTQILNGTATTGNDQTVAAALYAIKTALNGGVTTVNGGLILTNLIYLRDANNNVKSGISGAYNSNATGGGIAAWYGGEPIDHEVDTTASNYAKSLFRFDGSGYVADGNITWNANGAVTIKNITTLSDSQNTNLLNELATFNSAFTFATSGQGSTTALSITPNVPFTSLLVQSNNTNYAVWHGANHPTTISGYGITDAYTKSEVYTKTESDGRFITKEFFETLFNALDSSGVKVNANSTSGIASIKAMFGFWTEQYISALGQNSSGGGGSGTGDVTWDLLASNSDTRQIALSHLTTALSGYATTSALSGYLPLSGGTISATSSWPYASLVVNNNDTQSWSSSANFLSPNQPLNSWSAICIGHNLATNNVAHLSFNYAGNESEHNRFEVGFLNNTSLLVVKANGYVGIGTNNPTNKLNISGNSAGSTPLCLIEDTGTADWLKCVSVKYPNIVNSNWGNLIIGGKAFSNNNSAWIAYRHVEDGSQSNELGMGFWGSEANFRMRCSGKFTLISTVRETLELKQNATGSGVGSLIYFYLNDVLCAGVGYNNSKGVFLENNVGGNKALWIEDAGNLTYQNNIVLHTGNYTSYLGYIGTTAIQSSSATQSLTGIGNITSSNFRLGTGISYGNRSALLVNSSSGNPSDIILRTGNFSTGTWGDWTISSRGNSGESSALSYAFVIARGAQNGGTSSEDICFKIEHSTNVIIGSAIEDTSAVAKLHVVGDVYSTVGFKKQDSSDSYVLLGGGGHKSESSLSVLYASSAGSVAWGSVTSKPSAAGDATTPVYWTGSGFATCTSYANASVGNADTVDGEHSSAFLHLTGGTMTGVVGFNHSSHLFETTGSGTITIFKYVGSGTPVPFKISDSSTSGAQDVDNYGTLHIERLNTSNGYNNAASSIYFCLKNPSGVSEEACGISGLNTQTGKLVFRGRGRAEIGSIDSTGLVVSGNIRANGFWAGTGFHIAGRAGIRINSTSTAYPSDILLGHSDSWSQWNNVYWALSARGSDEDYRFSIWRGNALTSENELFVLTKDLNVGIGTTSPSFKLTVNGYTRTNRLYLTDSIYLEYDSANSGIHVVGAGLYADTYISALGASTGTAGGVGDVTWDALASSNDTRQIALSHLTSALSGYATRSWVGQNYLSLSGGTITDGDKTTMIDGDGLAFLYMGSQIARFVVTNTVDGSEFHVSGVTNFDSNMFVTGSLTINGDTSTALFIYGESGDGYGRMWIDGDGFNFDCTGGANQLYFVDNSYFAGDWVDVDGRMGIGIDHSNTYQLTVNGQVGATGFVNTSDLRKKTIMGDVPINLYNVANAPLFKFTWKDEKEYSGQHIGSAAQYWQTVLPELVIQGCDKDMTLAMQYDVIALASVITVAKTVVSHEERITILEKENETLRKEIEKLKAA